MKFQKIKIKELENEIEKRDRVNKSLQLRKDKLTIKTSKYNYKLLSQISHASQKRNTKLDFYPKSTALNQSSDLMTSKAEEENKLQ